jgi:phosphoribosylformylglycinamidine cyclo-ligase
MIIDYKSAGVNIEAGNEAVKRIKHMVEKTFSNHVLTNIGSFGAMYDLKYLMETYQHPVLVQSIDGVGTKTIIARMMNKYDTLGIDLVSATANDIIVLGAKPLTFLDYIANDRLDPQTVEAFVSGMVTACLDNDISLIGGETAEMPGTYVTGEHDLVGIITGVVEKERAILGKNIQAGDVVLAFPSNGLHTNGYSLARKLCFDIHHYAIDAYFPELACTLGEALLKPHINYTRPVLHLLQQNIAIAGMAHITGGGLLENIPRILPDGLSVQIDKHAWPSLPLFELLCKLGHLTDNEAYRAFNMGVGLVMILPEDQVSQTRALLPDYALYQIGRVVAGQKQVQLCA